MKNLYKFTETGRKNGKTFIEQYSMKMTAEEVREYCKNKRAIYGGSKIDGGDSSYDCFAVLWN